VQSTRKHEKQANYLEAEKLMKGAYLLLVEDNAVNQELALEILQDGGLRVDVANNGAEAVEKVMKTDYDGVLMDCQMPIMDGFEATRKIRQDARFADLPILAMTANAMAGDKEKCLECGMNDHIPKPIDVAQLFLTMAQWIKPKKIGLEIEGLDIKGALGRVVGNEKLLRKLLGRFVQTQADVTERIKMSISTNDMETAIREAHTLKGLAGNIGASLLFGFAVELEKILKEGKTDSFDSAIEILQVELSSLIKEISSVIGDPIEISTLPTASSVDIVALETGFRRLDSLLLGLDSGAIVLAEELFENLVVLGLGHIGEDMKKLVNEFEFTEARKELPKIAKALHIVL
jgi:CheY-like chemotaxis protein